MVKLTRSVKCLWYLYNAESLNLCASVALKLSSTHFCTIDSNVLKTDNLTHNFTIFKACFKYSQTIRDLSHTHTPSIPHWLSEAFTAVQAHLQWRVLRPAVSTTNNYNVTWFTLQPQTNSPRKPFGVTTGCNIIGCSHSQDPNRESLPPPTLPFQS